jgi:hypothetical protein
VRKRVVLVEFVNDSRGAEKVEHTGGANKISCCSTCRGLALLKAGGRNTHPYIGGYTSKLPVFTNLGQKECHVGDPALWLTHEQIMGRGTVIEQLEVDCRDPTNKVPAIRLKEMKTASGMDRISLVYKILPWMSGKFAKVHQRLYRNGNCLHGCPRNSSFVLHAAVTAFPPAYLHTLLLGLLKDHYKTFVNVFKSGAFKALKREDERLRFVGLPSEYNRGLKPVYPSCKPHYCTHLFG